jgi:hypothetical protein
VKNGTIFFHAKLVDSKYILTFFSICFGLEILLNHLTLSIFSDQFLFNKKIYIKAAVLFSNKKFNYELKYNA